MNRTSLHLSVAIIVGAALITATGALYVQQKSAQTAAAYRVQELRSRLIVLEQQQAVLSVEASALARPQRLAHLARTVLELTPPTFDKTVDNSASRRRAEFAPNEAVAR